MSSIFYLHSLVKIRLHIKNQLPRQRRKKLCILSSQLTEIYYRKDDLTENIWQISRYILSIFCLYQNNSVREEDRSCVVCCFISLVFCLVQFGRKYYLIIIWYSKMGMYTFCTTENNYFCWPTCNNQVYKYFLSYKLHNLLL